MWRFVTVEFPDHSEKPREIDLDNTRSVKLPDFPRGNPRVWNVRLHFDPGTRLAFYACDPCLRLSGTRVRWGTGKEEDYPTPDSLERARQHWFFSKDSSRSQEDAQELARRLGVTLPSDFFSVVSTPEPVPLVILGKPGDEPMVNGTRKRKLTKAQYDVVNALLDVGDGGLSKDSLAAESGHGDAHRVLKRLADSDPDWKSVIQMAERSGGRYRIRTAKNLPGSPGN
jgi:hypothetical protein